MARIVLASGETVTAAENVITDQQAPLIFQREGGTHAVIIQQANKDKDLTADGSWRDVGVILKEDGNRQAVTIDTAEGYAYRVKLDGTTADTEVSADNLMTGLVGS